MYFTALCYVQVQNICMKEKRGLSLSIYSWSLVRAISDKLTTVLSLYPQGFLGLSKWRRNRQDLRFTCFSGDVVVSDKEAFELSPFCQLVGM